MNPEWLRYFVAIAETRHLQTAAERLHVTPQAVSKAIAGLESHYGARLVERDRRIRGLTPAGAVLLEEARGVLAGLENAERRVAAVRGGEVIGPVRIAGDSLWHHHLLPPLLSALRERHPRMRPQLHEMLPEDAERWVAAGEVDLGLLLRPPRRDDLEWREGLATHYVIVGRPQAKGRWDDFSYVVPRFFQRELAEPLDGWPEHQFKRDIAAEVELLETAIALAEAGVGVAFLPELAVRDRLAAGSLAVLADAPCAFSDHLFVVWRKGVQPTTAASVLLEALEG